MSGIRVLVIAYGSQLKPSTRLRIMQYLPALEQRGLRFDRLFVPTGAERIPSAELAEGLQNADVVFVQKVLTRDLIRALRGSRKPVVFDVDDAIHYIRQSQYPRALEPHRATDRLRNAYRATLRGGRFYSSRKRILEDMLGLATRIIVGNQWLFDEFQLTNDRAMVLPTSVWLDEVPTKEHTTHEPLTLGWIGVRSNLYHLEMLHDAFAVLQGRYPGAFEINIVSSESVPTPLPTRFTPWSLETESDSVLSFDIGLMPLQDDPFSRGKCAFKAVFCMSRGVPVVASPVGANAALIEHRVNGWLASSTNEWVDGLAALASDKKLRTDVGRRARWTIDKSYSAQGVAPHLADLLRAAAAPWQ